MSFGKARMLGPGCPLDNTRIKLRGRPRLLLSGWAYSILRLRQMVCNIGNWADSTPFHSTEIKYHITLHTRPHYTPYDFIQHIQTAPFHATHYITPQHTTHHFIPRHTIPKHTTHYTALYTPARHPALQVTLHTIPHHTTPQHIVPHETLDIIPQHITHCTTLPNITYHTATHYIFTMRHTTSHYTTD